MRFNLKGKYDLMQGLGYISKTGNIAQYGTFTHRELPIDASPEVYRFNYQVKTVKDAQKYFYKIIKENLGKDEDIIKRLAKRDDDIGQWLQRNRQHTNAMHKLAQMWSLDYANEQKQGFAFKFVEE